MHDDAFEFRRRRGVALHHQRVVSGDDVSRRRRQLAHRLKSHRLFPHVTRACQGVILQTVEQVRHYMAKTKTTTGLNVLVNILDQVYATGKKVAKGFKEAMRILFDDFLPKWNYRALPS